jgi:hypothetical protein
MKGYGGMARATIFPYTYLTMQNSMETFLAVCYKHMLTNSPKHVHTKPVRECRKFQTTKISY